MRASRGITGCSAIRDRRSRHPRWVMRSTLASAISKCAASAATRIKPWRSTSSAAPSTRRSMSWSATCVAGTARRSDGIRTSGAIWSRCDRPRFRRAIRRQRGGRASGELKLSRDNSRWGVQNGTWLDVGAAVFAIGAAICQSAIPSKPGILCSKPFRRTTEMRWSNTPPKVRMRPNRVMQVQKPKNQNNSRNIF
jgi:hypothetical protein